MEDSRFLRTFGDSVIWLMSDGVTMNGPGLHSERKPRVKRISVQPHERMAQGTRYELEKSSEIHLLTLDVTGVFEPALLLR